MRPAATSVLLLAALAFAPSAPAQATAQAQATATATATEQTSPIAPEEFGTVSGRVICSDTQRPARLAEVRFVPVPAAKPPQQPSGKGFRLLDGNGDLLPPVETDMDGRFLASHLRPGRYYVRIDLAGYLTPILAFSQQQLDRPTPDIQERLHNDLTEITVQPHARQQLELSIVRGASVTGTVLYDDGSPAIGVDVTLLRKDAKGNFTEEVRLTHFVLGTNERGQFHLSAFPAGEYVAQAMLELREHSVSTMPMPNGGGDMQLTMVKTSFELPVFSGDALRRRDAVPFTINASEDRSDLIITLPISKLHRVSGALIAKDGHSINGGKVSLRYADDNTELTSVKIDREGKQFQFPYVPEGTYTLAVEDARDVTEAEVPNGPGVTPRTRLEEKTVRRYGKAEQPLIVQSDLEGVLATVPDSTSDVTAATAAPSTP